MEVLQVIYKEYTFDEFVDFSNSTFEMNWKVNNLLTEIQSVSGRVKVSRKSGSAQRVKAKALSLHFCVSWVLISNSV